MKGLIGAYDLKTMPPATHFGLGVSPLDRRGLPRTSMCATLQPRRPILRPGRDEPKKTKNLASPVRSGSSPRAGSHPKTGLEPGEWTPTGSRSRNRGANLKVGRGISGVSHGDPQGDGSRSGTDRQKRTDTEPKADRNTDADPNPNTD